MPVLQYPKYTLQNHACKVALTAYYKRSVEEGHAWCLPEQKGVRDMVNALPRFSRTEFQGRLPIALKQNPG